MLGEIEITDLPAGYEGKTHQAYVDKRMAGLTPQQQNRIGQLWKERREADPQMRNAGQSFVRIMEYVAEHEK